MSNDFDMRVMTRDFVKAMVEDGTRVVYGDKNPMTEGLEFHDGSDSFGRVERHYAHDELVRMFEEIMHDYQDVSREQATMALEDAIKNVGLSGFDDSAPLVGESEGSGG